MNNTSESLQSPPTRSFSRFLAGIFLLGAVLLHAGCVAVVAGGAGAGAVAYIRGEVKVNVSATVEETANAANSVIASMDLNLIQSESDAASAEIIARTSDDRRVRVKLSKEGKNVTEVRVRVGTFGDETLSREIFNQIESRL